MSANKTNKYFKDFYGTRITREELAKIRKKRGKVQKKTIELACGLQALEDLAKGRIKKI